MTPEKQHELFEKLCKEHGSTPVQASPVTFCEECARYSNEPNLEPPCTACAPVECLFRDSDNKQGRVCQSKAECFVRIKSGRLRPMCQNCFDWYDKMASTWPEDRRKVWPHTFVSFVEGAAEYAVQPRVKGVPGSGGSETEL